MEYLYFSVLPVWKGVHEPPLRVYYGFLGKFIILITVVNKKKPFRSVKNEKLVMIAFKTLHCQ